MGAADMLINVNTGSLHSEPAPPVFFVSFPIAVARRYTPSSELYPLEVMQSDT